MDKTPCRIATGPQEPGDVPGLSDEDIDEQLRADDEAYAYAMDHGLSYFEAVAQLKEKRAMQTIRAELRYVRRSDGKHDCYLVVRSGGATLPYLYIPPSFNEPTLTAIVARINQETESGD